MRTGRFAFGTCNYGRWIFVVGGIKEIVQVDRGQSTPDSLTSCDDYNVVRNEWGSMPDLPEGRIGPSLLVINHVLYCIGGVGKLTNIFSYSLKGDGYAWQQIVGDMHLWCHSGCFYLPPTEKDEENKSNLLLFGGADLNDNMTDVITKVKIDTALGTFKAT
jgi:hypothetical protein